METITQLGLGGILTLLILREVFRFLGERKDRENRWAGEERRTGGTIGEQSTEYWRESGKRLTLECLESTVIPILKAQTDILSRLEERSGKAIETDIKNSYVLSEVKESIEKVRNSNHLINENLQRMVGRSALS